MMKYRVSTHHKDMWFYGKLIYKIKGVNNYEKESIVVFTSRDDTGAESCSGDVEIIQVNKTVQSAYELQDEINECDIIAIVAPINLQQQFIKLANGKPVIMALNDRVLTNKLTVLRIRQSSALLSGNDLSVLTL